MVKKAKTKLHKWQKKAREGGICEKCKIETPYLTVDHIIPIFVIEALDETGIMKYEDESNFQFLCKICNFSKGSRIDKRNPKTKEMFLKLLN